VTDRSAAATLATAVGIGLVVQYLFVRESLGVNVVVATTLALAAAAALRPRSRSFDARDAWLPIGTFVFAGLCAIRADVPLVIFDVTAALGLLLGSALALRGASVWDLPVVSLAFATADASLASLSGAAEVIRRGAPAVRAFAPSRSSRLVPHVGGALLAVPFLLLFGTLFSSADAVFRHALENLVDVTELRRLFAELPARVLLALLAAWLVAGWLGHLEHGRQPEMRDERTLFGPEAATTMLIAIDTLFASFVAIQLAYLFGGRETLDVAGISYSTYGRAGFFELVVAASVVAALLFTLDLVVRRRGRPYVAAALLLVALTAVVVASATLRMQLYQAAYGWSELRFYAFAGIAYIALALLLIAWALARDSMRHALQRLVVAGLLVAVVVNLIGPSGFVARRNIERVIDPASLPDDASRELDVAYLISLGDGAWPTMVELAAALREPDHSTIVEALRREGLRRPPLLGWQSWILDREVARSLVVRASAGDNRFIR